mmetsp:Transcript_660/g.794  ORF Transcript_660/g.794 Transcript_660/m.794 type:complete len:85 (+) Transcript_660:945-1199(+)
MEIEAKTNNKAQVAQKLLNAKKVHSEGIFIVFKNSIVILFIQTFKNPNNEPAAQIKYLAFFFCTKNELSDFINYTILFTFEKCT